MTLRTPAQFSLMAPQRPAALAVSAFLALMLTGCGGGSGSSTTETGGGTGGGGGATTQAGTYALKAGSATVGSFMLDSANTVTGCVVGQDTTCTPQVTVNGNSTNFTLKGGSTSASGTIAANGAVTGQLTQAGGAVSALTGSKTSSDYVDCTAPSTRSNGQCVLPSTKIVIAPTVTWLIDPTAGGTWTPATGMQFNTRYTLCFGYGECDRFVKTFLVTPDDLKDEDAEEILAYAQSVAKDFQEMIGRMWKAKTYPPFSLMQKIFRESVENAIATESQNAAQTAARAFAAAGYPAAGGGASGTPSGSEPTTASACGNLAYAGDMSEPQVSVFDLQAMSYSCAYKASGDANALTYGNRVCKLLDDYVKALEGKFHPLYCNGPKLKVS